VKVAPTQTSHQAWLDQIIEDVIEPALPITDTHHHLWQNFGRLTPFQPDFTRQNNNHAAAVLLMSK
jgi:hypothetical protein